MVDPAGRREVDYWKCRRSLRLRPVGEGPEVEAAIGFMREFLKLDGSFLDLIEGRITARRVPFGPKARYKHEIIVVFDSVEARDVVRGAATNLAGRGPDYGVRLEVPNHLRSAMKALQTLSYELRQRNPQARRNILYDDEAQDLVLDFQLNADAVWRRVTAAQAKAKKQTIGGTAPGSRMNVEDSELDDLLSRSVSPAEMNIDANDP